MARKFQVGDKVEVVKNTCIDGDNHNRKLGDKGEIIDYQIDYPGYPYKVKFRKTKKESYPYDNFNAKELKLVN